MPPFDLDPLLLDTLEDAVIVTSPDGLIARWNRGAERLYGWRATEVIGKNISQVTVPAQGWHQAQTIMEQLRLGESWTGEFWVRRRDRSTFLAEVTDHAILDDENNIVAIVGVSRIRVAG